MSVSMENGRDALHHKPNPKSVMALTMTATEKLTMVPPAPEAQPAPTASAHHFAETTNARVAASAKMVAATPGHLVHKSNAKADNSARQAHAKTFVTASPVPMDSSVGKDNAAKKIVTHWAVQPDRSANKASAPPTHANHSNALPMNSAAMANASPLAKM
jgi:hypothetical protein